VVIVCRFVSDHSYTSTSATLYNHVVVYAPGGTPQGLTIIHRHRLLCNAEEMRRGYLDSGRIWCVEGVPSEHVSEWKNIKS
jgi:hypothetical protein